MSKLAGCIANLKDSISPRDKSKLLELEKEYLKNGSDAQKAASMAIFSFYKDLNSELNKALSQLNLPTKAVHHYPIERVRTEIEAINHKYDTLKKIEEETHQFKLTDSELERLIDDGHDNASIVKAVAEANRLLRLPVKELFNELQKIGVFNLGRGEKYEFRPDVGLSTEEYKNTLRQLKEGKETKTVEKLLDYVADVKKTGDLKLMSGVGGMTERFNFPLYSNLLGEKPNAERGLSEKEESENLSKLEAQKQYEESLQKKKGTVAPTADIQKVVERMQKALPKFKISYDDKLNAAGKIKGNEISINPFYAGKDTPIHEAGHALIDFIGYSNKVIQKGIEQLKKTPLWAETKQRYPELSDEMLGKEVLAEAIGREGADIFDTEVEKSKFKQVLDYIFDWLKRKLGLEKNVAKSLAKQIISGVGTKNVEVKVNKETKSLFDESVKMFYKIKDTEGAAKKRNLAEQRRIFLESNPSVKYIEDNIKSIYKQLEQANKLIKEGDCV